MHQLTKKMGANRTIMALSFARLGDAVGNSILFVIIPLYVGKLAAPWFPFPEAARAGFLIAVYGFVNVLLQPIGGALTDRFQRRKIFILLGLFLIGFATIAFIFADRFLHLLILRSVQGIGVALTIPAVLAIMTSSSEHETRGGSMGIYSAMRMIGLSIGPVIGGYLHDHYSFNSAFYAGAGFIFIGILMVQMWVKDPTINDQSSNNAGDFHFIDPNLLSKEMLGLGFASFLMAFAFSMITPLEQEFNTRLGQSALSFGFSFTALLGSRLLFQYPFGRLSDIRGRKVFIIYGLLLMTVSTGFLGFVQTTWQLMVLRIFQGIASAAIAAPVFALAGDLSKKGSEGRQMSIVTMGFGLGIALGPLLAGVLVAASFQLPFLIGGLLALSGSWVVAHFVPETVNHNKKRSSIITHHSVD